jgi:hypothetical protein
VSEILYHSGGYTRVETEKFSQEIQSLLLLSFTDSYSAIAASFLASWLASRLTHSPNIISTVGIGASIVTAVAGNVLTMNTTFAWMALQTGVALIGSAAGSFAVHKFPEIGRWGFNSASNARNYLSSKISFWSSHTDTVAEEKMALMNRAPATLRLG